MLISIIILNYHSRELLRLCLQSLQRYLNPKDILHEIIVVDSEAELETEEMLVEEFPHIQYRPHQKNTGFAAGVNDGLRQAKGEYLLILNPDIILEQNSVQNLIKFMEANPQVGLAGPRLLNFNRQTQYSCFRFYQPSTILYRRTWLGKLPIGKKALKKFHYTDRLDEKNNKPLEVDWLMGAALITRRQALKKIGELDERFFLYFEDVDWSKRFWENGYKVVYVPQITMFHYHVRRSKVGWEALDLIFRRESRWHLQSGFKYFKKHGWRYHSGQTIGARLNHVQPQ